ncbi:MAG TPA: hypothetical protein EYG79_00540 [Rhodobacteraceae bacterium]|nr:hypothetical protein [Paracoccaceae bacterium]
MAVSDDNNPTTSILGEISPVGEFGVFELVAEPDANSLFQRPKYFRLWGVNIRSEALGNFVGQEIYGCETVGSVQSMSFGPLAVVECVSASVGNLSKSLLDAGVAQPICVEFDYEAVCP